MCGRGGVADVVGVKASTSRRCMRRIDNGTLAHLLRSIRKMQKSSQKSQILRDRQRNHLKSAREWEEEMQMLNNEMEEMKSRFRALSEKSGDCRKAAAELENEIQTLQAGEERRGSSASQSNGCCFAPTMLGQVFALGEARATSFMQFICRALQNSRRSGAVQEEKRKEIGKETRMIRRSKVGSGCKWWKQRRRKSQHAEKWNACSRQLPFPA